MPFCTELCFYCGCNTRAVRKREPVDAYAERLLEEIALLEGLSGRKLTHLHWGGGTPSILGPEWLETIAAQLASRFDLSALKEHAIELDPRRLDKPLVRTLAAIGVNRASLGMQDASPHVQQAIGRVQPFELVERAADWLREAGIANLNIDLMYGLPEPDRARRRAQRRTRRLAQAAAAGAVRLCPCAVVQDPSEADRRRRAARPVRAARAGAGGGRDAGQLRLPRRSASTISRCPPTSSASPRASAGCTAISRATPPTTPTR